MEKVIVDTTPEMDALNAAGERGGDYEGKTLVLKKAFFRPKHQATSISSTPPSKQSPLPTRSTSSQNNLSSPPSKTAKCRGVIRHRKQNRMAFKLSKANIKERDEMLQAARLKFDNLNDAIETFNSAMAEAWEELEEALSDYNGALSDARDFVERVKEEFTTEYDEKSEKWQEGDRGTAAREWIDSFDNVELDDAELEAPEAMDQITADGLDTLENLETEAAS